MKKTLYIPLLSLLSIVAGVAALLVFRGFFTANTPPYATEIAAAFIGAVVTIIVTAVLLKLQSSTELTQEKSGKIFTTKLERYSDFIVRLYSITKDGKITDTEAKELHEWVFKLSLICGAKVTEHIIWFLEQNTYYAKNKLHWNKLKTEAEKKEWRDGYKECFEKDPCPITTHEDKDGKYEKNLDFATIGTLIAALKEDLGEEYFSNKEEKQKHDRMD